MSLTPLFLLFAGALLLLILLSGKSQALLWALWYPDKPMPPDWSGGGPMGAPGGTSGGGGGGAFGDPPGGSR